VFSRWGQISDETGVDGRGRLGLTGSKRAHQAKASGRRRSVARRPKDDHHIEAPTAACHNSNPVSGSDLEAWIEPTLVLADASKVPTVERAECLFNVVAKIESKILWIRGILDFAAKQQVVFQAGREVEESLSRVGPTFREAPEGRLVRVAYGNRELERALDRPSVASLGLERGGDPSQPYDRAEHKYSDIANQIRQVAGTELHAAVSVHGYVAAPAEIISVLVMEDKPRTRGPFPMTPRRRRCTVGGQSRRLELRQCVGVDRNDVRFGVRRNEQDSYVELLAMLAEST